MAEMDHYENGKWVGSTKIEGHSNTTGWVDTYSTDGKVRSTMIRNTNTFDYKPEQHPPKSIEQIQDERAGKKFLEELFGKIYKPLLIFSVIGVSVVYIIIPAVIMIKEGVFKEYIAGLASIAMELVGGKEGLFGFIILSVVTVLFYYILYRLLVGKKSKKKKK